MFCGLEWEFFLYIIFQGGVSLLVPCVLVSWEMLADMRISDNCLVSTGSSHDTTMSQVSRTQHWPLSLSMLVLWLLRIPSVFFDLSKTACLSKEYWISPCKLVQKQECRTLVKTRSSSSVLKIESFCLLCVILRKKNQGLLENPNVIDLIYDYLTIDKIPNLKYRI